MLHQQNIHSDLFVPDTAESDEQLHEPVRHTAGAGCCARGVVCYYGFTARREAGQGEEARGRREVLEGLVGQGQEDYGTADA